MALSVLGRLHPTQLHPLLYPQTTRDPLQESHPLSLTVRKGPSGANELPVLAAAAWLQHPWHGIGPACARQEVDKKTQDKKAVDPDRKGEGQHCMALDGA